MTERPVISFVVSTCRPEDFARLRANLEETVRSSYELIPVENPGRYGLCEAYNLGARRAQGKFLCFVHEDAVFCDKEWDVGVLQRFGERADLGLMGVAGMSVWPGLPIGVFCGDPRMDRCTVRHLEDDGVIVEKRCPYPADECGVRVLDGLFLFTRRHVWEQFPFNETIEGFHFYDIDFSLRISQQWRLEVAPELMIEHISTEQLNASSPYRNAYNADWVRAALNYQPDQVGLTFDELSPEQTIAIKRFWLAIACSPECPIRLRWKYWRKLDLSLGYSYWGLPLLAPGLFKALKSRLHRYRRARQERYYARGY